jgi:molybdopterin-guanine dinucleotide biosynthesis protein B
VKTYLYRGTPVLGFAAYSGSGKTTLIRKLIPEMISRGIHPAIVKHAHHDFDIDYPGKDSFELRKAGAKQVLVGSDQRWAMVVETPSSGEAEFTDFLARLDLNHTNVILVEGFRHVRFPKIEVYRQELKRDLFYLEDNSIIAVATDCTAAIDGEIPVIELDRTDKLADFIVDYCRAAIDQV